MCADVVCVKVLLKLPQRAALHLLPEPAAGTAQASMQAGGHATPASASQRCGTAVACTMQMLP